MKQEVTDGFYRNKDVQEILDIKEAKAGNIIRELNKELADKGYITVQGRVPKKYFRERLGLDL